jgi:hypothetical protein
LAFVVGGAQKAGTSTLDALFRRHPHIQMARRKETHFFDDESRDWTRPDYGELELFFPTGSERLRGESTPITLYWRPAIRRLHAYNPEVKLIFLLRDPVTRAFSQWCKEYARGRETLAFSDAIRHGRARVRAESQTAEPNRYFSYVERGFYGEQLLHVLEYFPRGSVHCEISEEMFRDRSATLRRIATFLDIDPWPQDTPPAHLNPRREHEYPSTLAPADVAYLRTLFEDDTRLVESLLGRPIPDWRSAYADRDSSRVSVIRASHAAALDVTSPGQPAKAENPYVFVCGCPRSGTTLLQRMLDSHPELAVLLETNVVPRPLLGKHPAPDLPLTDELVGQVIGFKWFGHLGVDQETASGLAVGCPTFAAFVRGLLDEAGRRRGKRFVGEKVPGYVRRMPSLHGLFPSARFIHIIRDGRDVALSMFDWITPERWLGRMPMWREEPVAVCALNWQREVSGGVRGRDKVGAGRCLEVRYEDLVQAPEPTVRRIAVFLDLPFDTAMLDFHRGKTWHRPGLSSKDKWLPPTVGLRDWRVDLSPRDLQLFEALAGDLLASLGYPLAAAGGSREVDAVAERCLRRWETEVGHQTRI